MYFFEAFRPIGLDMLSTIFFVGLLWLTGNIFLATGIGMAAGLARFAYMKFRGRQIGALNYLSLVLVMAAGGTTLVTRNPIFILLKPSIIKFAIGLVMLSTDWLSPYLPRIVTDSVSREQLVWHGRAWGLLNFALGAACAYVAFAYSQQTWAWFVATVPLVTMFLMFLLQYGLFRLAIVRKIREQAAQAIE